MKDEWEVGMREETCVTSNQTEILDNLLLWVVWGARRQKCETG